MLEIDFCHKYFVFTLLHIYRVRRFKMRGLIFVLFDGLVHIFGCIAIVNAFKLFQLGVKFGVWSYSYHNLLINLFIRSCICPDGMVYGKFMDNENRDEKR
ncbi:hypothetical protein TW84_18985 [Vibrio neptunius]|nr:hypothetical protein TW84_18985 [Vibrio neptunius]